MDIFSKSSNSILFFSTFFWLCGHACLFVRRQKRILQFATLLIYMSKLVETKNSPITALKQQHFRSCNFKLFNWFKKIIVKLYWNLKLNRNFANSFVLLGIMQIEKRGNCFWCYARFINNPALASFGYRLNLHERSGTVQCVQT